jgi:hypothetical protein
MLTACHDGLMKQLAGALVLAEHHAGLIAVVGTAVGIAALLFWLYW